MNKFSLHTPTLQSNSWYEVINYPMGEMQVRITLPELLNEKLDKLDRLEVKIVSRIYCPADLVELGLLCNALDGLGVVGPTVILPYLPFSRADRRFVKGDCKGISFVSQFLAAYGINAVTLDVHNKKVTSWFVRNIDPNQYIKAAIEHTAVRHDSKVVSVLYPDKGASERYNLPTSVGSNANAIEVKYFYAEKKRDAKTGKLTGFKVPYLPEGIPVLIVDDICDGGGTFLGVAAAIKEVQALDVSLYTTHGGYTKGTQVLYDGGISYLYTTNSYYRDNPTSPDKMLVYDCIPQMLRSC